MDEKEKKYEDILYLPHHVSSVRPRMSRQARAAQFSAFAALSGYEDAVKETARLTDTQSELTEDEKAAINEKLLMIVECSQDAPKVRVTYFVEDKKKSGGSYVQVSGIFERIDEFEKLLHLSGTESIPIERIRSIEASCLVAEWE